MDRAGLRRKLLKAQAEAGDIVLLSGDESEALTKRHPELDSSDTQNWTLDYVVPTSGSASVFRLSSPDRLFSRRR